MKYTRPEMELISFQNSDILTESEELSLIPAEEKPVSDRF